MKNSDWLLLWIFACLLIKVSSKCARFVTELIADYDNAFSVEFNLLLNKHLTPFQLKSMFHLSFHRLMVSFDMVTQCVYLYEIFMSVNSHWYNDICDQVYWYGGRQDLVTLYISVNSRDDPIINVRAESYYKGVI